MSYSGDESLEMIIHELKAKLDILRRRLQAGEDVETLHGLVEMLECLILRYDRGEILDTVTTPSK